MAPVFPLLLAAGSLLLAGCLGQGVTVAGQGYEATDQVRALGCNKTARLSWAIEGAGSLGVSVTDGANQTVHEAFDADRSLDGREMRLEGEPGTWMLRVHRNEGYAGQFAITLSC